MPVNAHRELIRADFNRIAQWAPAPWDRNVHYHTWLLKQLPDPCDRVLEIGCGHGVLTAKLARRARHVFAVDLSEAMLSAAAATCQSACNVSLVQADFLEATWPDDYFDAVVSVAALHHMPMNSALNRIAATLKPGGMALVIDLYKTKTLVDGSMAVLGLPYGKLLQRFRTGRWFESRETMHLWIEHSSHDRLMSFPSIRSTFSVTMPGSQVRRRLLFRYAAAWRKPR